MDTSRYRVPPDAKVDLDRYPTDDGGALDRDDVEKETKKLNKRLEQLQEVMHAEGEQKLLVVIQATDTGGKDGTIRHVFDGTNPAGVTVAAFKKPTEEELGHDYLWRVHRHAPGAGQIAIFNRSHYEDVLVVRVHSLVPEERWRRRYRHIREFERLLTDEGTTIVKFFLHISKDEQRERLQDRLDDPDKHWKFRLGDLDERERWDDYQAAFAEMLDETSTDTAPWWVIPADRKWFRNRVISQVLVETLEGLGLDWPPAEEDLTGVIVV